MKIEEPVDLSLHIWWFQMVDNIKGISFSVLECFRVSLNKGTAAMLVSPTNPPGTELYSYANVFFCFGWKTFLLITWVKALFWLPVNLMFVRYTEMLIFGLMYLSQSISLTQSKQKMNFLGFTDHIM